MNVTLTMEQHTELRDAMYRADHALRAVLDSSRGGDPPSLKHARNSLAVALTTLRVVKRHAEDEAEARERKEIA